MLENILVFCLGLIAGWNFLPQPKWVKPILAKIFGGMGKIEINVNTPADTAAQDANTKTSNTA